MNKCLLVSLYLISFSELSWAWKDGFRRMCSGKKNPQIVFAQLLSGGSSANACFGPRSQMELSYSCPSTALVCKSWWACGRPLNTFCSCSFDGHMQLTNEAETVFLQSLSHCELITDDGIRHLGSGPCAHDRLEVIELDNCPLITDASLEHLKSCHSLDRIELYDCQQITRAGIKRLRVSNKAAALHTALVSFEILDRIWSNT